MSDSFSRYMPVILLGLAFVVVLLGGFITLLYEDFFVKSVSGVVTALAAVFMLVWSAAFGPGMARGGTR